MKMNLTKAALWPLLCGAAFLGQLAWAQEVSITDAWVRGTIGTRKSAAVYFVIHNAKPALLMGAESAVAEEVELEEMVIADIGPMRPKRVDSIRAAGGEPTRLTPLTYYLRLKGLKRKLVEGERIAMTVRFDTSGGGHVTLPVEAVVKPFFVGPSPASR